MQPRTAVPIPYQQVEKFCRKWGIVELSLFGSVLRDDFRPDSDVDVLITFDSESHPTLFQLVDMQDELEAMFGRKVDLLSRRGVESSRNPFRRQAILDSARAIYAAA